MAGWVQAFGYGTLNPFRWCHERAHEQAGGLDQLQPVTVTSVTALEAVEGFQLVVQRVWNTLITSS